MEVVMSSGETTRDTTMADAAAVCPLASPLTARIPGLLSLAAVPAAIVANPFFSALPVACSPSSACCFRRRAAVASVLRVSSVPWPPAAWGFLSCAESVRGRHG